MKKILLATSIIALSASVNAETKVQTNPLGMVLGVFNGEATFAVTPKLSVGPKGAFWKVPEIITGEGTTLSVTTLGGVAQYDFNGAGQSGPYTKANVGWGSINYSYSDFDASCSSSLSVVSAGATAGYQWIKPSGFTSSIGAGYAISLGDPAIEAECIENGSSYTSEETLPAGTGGNLALEWNIGFSF